MHFPVVKKDEKFYARYVKGVPFVNGRYTRGVPLLLTTVYKRIRDWTAGRSLPVRNFVEWPSPGCTLTYGLSSTLFTVLCFFPWDRRDRARLTVYSGHFESNLSRYIWKSRWPPLKVRRARSRWSHGKMGTVNSLVVIFFGTRVGGHPNASHVHSNSTLLGSHHNMKLFEHNCKKN